MSKTARSCDASPQSAEQQLLAILPWRFEPYPVVRANLFVRHRERPRRPSPPD